MTDDWSLFATLPGSKIYIRRFSNHLSMSVALTFSSWFQCFLCHTCTESYHMKSFQQSIKMMGKLKYFLKTSKVYKIRHTYTHWLRQLANLYAIIQLLRLGITDIQLGGGGGGLPCPYLEIEKIALILEKKALILPILHFRFKIQF